MKAINTKQAEFPLYSRKKVAVFRNSALTDIIDEWFCRNGVYGLQFKCKAWNKLRNKVMKIEREAIKSFFSVDQRVKSVGFSVHAGCSMCPCSPGYIVKFDDGSSMKWHENYWLDLITKSGEVNSILEACREADKQLEQEIKENENKNS